MRKLTQEEFIKQCLVVHKNKYDYSLVEYINIRGKIKIICQSHGIFEQNAKNHRDGQGCKLCSGKYKRTRTEFIKKSIEVHGDKYDYSLVEYKDRNTKVKLIDKKSGRVIEQSPYLNIKGRVSNRLSTEIFIEKSKEIHGDKYDYSLVDYKNIKSKVKIRCNEYGFIFEQSPEKHLHGYGPGKVTVDIFTKKCLKIHGNKYDYSLVDRINSNKDKVNIICPNHGTFTQSVSNHMNNEQGCPKCAGIGLTLEEFIDRFKKEHGDKYNYSLVNETRWDQKLKIICNEHGVFEQSPSKHLYQGCPECKTISKGENKISKILKKYGVKYNKEHSFEGCKYVNRLPFDFYLPDYNMIIEYDGIQHFKPVEFFGGVEEFKFRKKIDNIKGKYCEDNNIYLIRIPYTEYENIDFIIKEKIINALSV